MTQKLLTRYHFTVEWGGQRIGFMEVSGLDIEIDTVTYREGSNPEPGFTKLPGLHKYSNITLKRGIVQGDNDFFSWINTATIGTVERRDVVISLLNEAHQPVSIWKIKNAFPVKYCGPLLDANCSEPAMETLVLTHEGISVESV